MILLCQDNIEKSPILSGRGGRGLVEIESGEMMVAEVSVMQDCEFGAAL